MYFYDIWADMFVVDNYVEKLKVPRIGYFINDLLDLKTNTYFR